MSIAHLEKLKSTLEAAHWVLGSPYRPETLAEHWDITRPNGDTPLRICFLIGGNGLFGARKGNETLSDAISCSVEGHPGIELYFGKFSGRFQEDVREFVHQLNAIASHSNHNSE